jgi:hypothetical protein
VIGELKQHGAQLCQDRIEMVLGKPIGIHAVNRAYRHEHGAALIVSDQDYLALAGIHGSFAPAKRRFENRRHLGPGTAKLPKTRLSGNSSR